MRQPPGSADHLIDDFGHVHWQTNSASLVGDRAADRLPNPPRRISRKLIAAAVFKLVYRFHEADIAFLDQVQEVQPAVRIFFCNRDHEPKISLDHLVLCRIGIHLPLNNGALRIAQFGEAHSGVAFKLLDLGTKLPLRSKIILLDRFAGALGDLLFQLSKLAFQRAHGICGASYALDQTFVFGGCEPKSAHDKRNSHDLASELQLAAAVLLGFFL